VTLLSVIPNEKETTPLKERKRRAVGPKARSIRKTLLVGKKTSLNLLSTGGDQHAREVRGGDKTPRRVAQKEG